MAQGADSSPAHIDETVLSPGVVVPPGAEAGVDTEADRARGFVIQDGLTVLGKDQPFPG